MRGRFERLSLRAALCVLLLGAPAAEAAAASEDVLVPFTANSASYFDGGLTINNSANPLLTITNRVYIDSSGRIGLGAANYGARLDVRSSGSGKVQIWRNSGGTEVGSISDAGALSGTTLPCVINSGTILFFNAACPSGWTELTGLAGRYLVAATASIGSTAGTALSNTENRPVGVHNHSVTETVHSHTNSGTITGTQWDADWVLVVTSYYNWAQANTGSASTNLTIDSFGTAGPNAPYVQFRLCQKN